jgi:alpha-L-rhamnosidase
VEAGVATDEAQLAGRLERYLDAPATKLVELAGGNFSPAPEAVRERLDSLLNPQ